MQNNQTETRIQADRSHRRFAIRVAAAVITIGCLLLMAALILPPPGRIDNSVLVAFGEICTFSGTVLGIGSHSKAKP